MSEPPYVFEDTPEGRWLVAIGQWSESAASALARGEADGLVLNYARGFREGNLDLLNGEWPLRRLSVIDRSLSNLEPIARLRRLEAVSVQAAPDAELDLRLLPQLRSVTGEWSLIARTLSAVEGLESLVTWMFGEVDLRALRDHRTLRALTVKDAPNLESLNGIGDLLSLASLTIVGAPLLQEIEELGWLSTALRELKLEDCGRIESIDVVERLGRLTSLGISDLGEIASLGPLGSLLELENFYAWGSTRILDGDLSPLERLPRLREIRMRNRRGYTPQVGDLAASVN